MKAFRVGLYVSIRLRHASVSSTEETALLLKRSDAFFNVRSAKSCDAAKLGGKSRPAAPATPVARKLLRVQESVILNLQRVVWFSRVYIDAPGRGVRTDYSRKTPKGRAIVAAGWMNASDLWR